MYITHPSAQLNEIFFNKPYQGVAPHQATFLFIGLDANYDEHIQEKPIFSKVLEYHNDGVTFWLNHGVHHPFLLTEYAGDGQFYHRSFARIGFQPQHANLVSFAELLHVPTKGQNKLDATDLDLSHLKMLDSAILEGKASHIFISNNVHQLMLASGAFPWLAKKPQKNEGPLGIYNRFNYKTVYKHLHFSVYGKYQEQKILEAEFIGNLSLPSQ